MQASNTEGRIVAFQSMTIPGMAADYDGQVAIPCKRIAMRTKRGPGKGRTIVVTAYPIRIPHRYFPESRSCLNSNRSKS